MTSTPPHPIQLHPAEHSDAPSARHALHLLRPCRDAGGRIVDCEVLHLNTDALHFLCLTEAPAAGTRVGELVSAERLEAFLREVENALGSGQSQFSEFEIKGRPADRRWMWHEVIPLGELIAVRSQTALDRHGCGELDELTGLLNEHGLKLRGQAILDALPRGNDALVVRLAPRRLFDIRDVFGAVFADAVLRAYAQRLAGVLAGSRSLAGRVGLNQFAVLLFGAGARGHEENGINGLESILDTTLEVNGMDFHITSAIGVARFPAHGTGLGDLLRAADMAYSASRRAHSRPVTHYCPRLGRQAQTRIAIQKGLAHAIERDELHLVLQPVVDGRLKPLGFEALMRWTSPELGVVPPSDFIPVAEETGLVIALGRWIFGQATRALARLQAEHGPGVYVAVNLSAVEFGRRDLADALAAVAAESGIEPASIELEITETALMHDVAESELQLQRLRSHGFRLSIDDFGTGYSSLGHLRRFPVDKLKIDRSFIAELESEPRDIHFVRAIVSLAEALHLPVVAEGIETRAQMDMLRGVGCDQFQGFLLGRPAPIEAHLPASTGTIPRVPLS